MNILPAVLAALSFLQYFNDKNTAANYVITPPKAGESVKAEKPDLVVRDKCPGCEGAGRLVLEEPNFGQANGRIGGAAKKKKECPICRGSGRIEAFCNPADLKLIVAQDRDEYQAEHQGKGDIQVGEAFVPNGKFKTLDDKTRKLVEEAFGHPCPACNWTGIEACKKCRGTGTVKCPSSDCKGGWQVVQTTVEHTKVKSGGNSIRSGGFRSGGTRRTSTKETKVNVSVCPHCGGAKAILCPDCNGRRAHPCKKCNGLGMKRQKAK